MTLARVVCVWLELSNSNDFIYKVIIALIPEHVHLVYPVAPYYL